jgi:hypothetical protein
VAAAAALLQGICRVPEDWSALLSAPTAAAAAATALASLVRRAAVFTKAAGAAHAAVAHELPAGRLQLAAYCFPAVVTMLFRSLGELGCSMCKAAHTWGNHHQQTMIAQGSNGGSSSMISSNAAMPHAATTSNSSSSGSSQSWASAALLAVLLARSAVVLADAMDAAAAAAGITPAELFARWVWIDAYVTRNHVTDCLISHNVLQNLRAHSIPRVLRNISQAA